MIHWDDDGGWRQSSTEILLVAYPNMNTKVIKPVNKTKESIVQAQSDTLVFNNKHEESEDSFQLIALRQ